MRESDQTVIGLILLGVLFLALAGYYLWNWVRSGIKLIAEQDIKEIESDSSKASELTSRVPGFIAATASLAGITIASIFIVIGLIVFQFDKFTGLEQAVVYVALGLLAIAGISWLFCLEFLTTMLALSLPTTELTAYYRRSMNLWSLAMTAISPALLLMLLLAQPCSGRSHWRLHIRDGDRLLETPLWMG